MVTRMVNHYDQDERPSDAALHRDTIRPVLLKAFAEHGAREFSEKHWLRPIREGSSKTRVEYCEDSKNSLAYFWAIQGHSGGISIDPELIRVHSDSLQFGKSIFFTGFVLSALNPSLRTDWFRVERKATKHGRLSSSHHLTHFGGDSNKEKTREDYTVPQTVHYHSHCKRCQDPEHKIKDCNSGKRSHMQSSYTVRCQQIASTEWSLKTEIEYCSEDSRPLDPRQKSPWKAIGIRSSSDSSLFVMMCRQVHGDLYGRANLGQETSAATQRMTRPVEGASCSVKSNDSKWIFE